MVHDHPRPGRSGLWVAHTTDVANNDGRVQPEPKTSYALIQYTRRIHDPRFFVMCGSIDRGVTNLASWQWQWHKEQTDPRMSSFPNHHPQQPSSRSHACHVSTLYPVDAAS